MILNRPVVNPLMLALLGVLAAPLAQASGYHFGSQSASAQGTANANAAEASDASVLFYNPAGLSRLEGTQASGVLNLVLPKGRFTDGGSFTQFRLPTRGGAAGDFVEPAAVPHAYLSHRYNERLTAGLGIFVPFGSKSEYDSNWTGRYNGISTELKTLTINPSLAFKLSNTLSLGAGVSAQHIEGKLAKGADFGSGAMASIVEAQVRANAIPGVPAEIIRNAVVNQLGGLIKTVSGNPTYSGRVDVEGKDWGVGFNLGLMYSPDDSTRFSIAYRSAIKHTLTGDAQWQVQTAAANLAGLLNAALPGAGSQVQAQLLGAYTNSAAKLSVKTPESLSFSFYKKHDARTAVMGDVTLTRHSRFKELRVDFANNLPDSVTPQGWTDTVRASLGVSHQWTDALQLRGGVAYDQSPVTQATRTSSIPDGDRSWLSAGLNWKLDNKRSLDFALSYIHVAAGEINAFDNGGQTNAVGSAVCNPAGNTSSCATVVGRYKLNSALLGVQYNHRF